MRRLTLVLLAALAGCGSPDEDDRGANALPDAGGQPASHDATGTGDVPAPPSIDERTPFTATGTTPGGSLDEVQFMSLEFVGGHCPGTYELKLYRTDVPEDPAVAMFSVTIPWNTTPPSTGTMAASAWAAGGATTDNASFEVEYLDAPGPDDTGPATVRMAGRFTSHAPGWNVDFSVDATAAHMVCLIL
jgi:hypothetical protein